jgi:hypothetical protein
MTTTGTPEAGTVMSIITADRLAVWNTKQTGRQAGWGWGRQAAAAAERC